ncbi:hypothetical protein SAMN05216223_12926 [Actinacidiphila yanglinensis]|uniref:Uncharacterized protein n=2 Tax=Actinacidiphila yanglinensis TaxID=310779 RepID=A0A1H6EAV8_9ACTN|nr:hypothetical protein SAMN05216223_12926 [Actinacidiphila yanglinensis]
MRRSRWITVGAAGAVAVGILVAVLVHQADGPSANDAEPPPLGAHKADVQRIVVVPDGNPMGHTGGIQLPDGRSVAFNVVTSDLIKPAPGPHEAELALEQDALERDDSQSDWHLVKAGDVITEYGIRVKVLKIWRMPNPDHDAMDLQADPLPTPPPTPVVTIPSTPATASPSTS